MRAVFIYRFIEKRDVRDYIVSIITGIVVGLFCLLFRWLIDEITAYRIAFLENTWSPFLRIPVYLSVCMLILSFVNRLVQSDPTVAGNGAEQTRGMLNGHLYRGKTLKHLMNKFAGALGSLGSGMALGREGPSIQFGGYLGILISRIFRITPGREEYIISAGASAGVAAALNAPLAGPVYIIESLQKFNNSRIAICSLLAGLSAGLIAAVLMPRDPYHLIPLIKPSLSDSALLGIFIGMGFYMAVIGALFTSLVKKIRRNFIDERTRRLHFIFLILLMGIVGYLFPEMLGSGEPFMLKQALIGSTETDFLLLLTLVCFFFCVYSQGSNFPGGAFLPLLTLGGMSGRLFGALLLSMGIVSAEQLPYFMFLGMSSAFVVVMRTPLTGFLLVAEMTGRYEILLPSLTVGIIGYFLISIVRMQPLPDNLYELLLQRLNSDNEKDIYIYTEVMPNSYFEGKGKEDLGLPAGCRIVKILRNHTKWDLSELAVLKAGDQIEFAIDTPEVEKVYQALICLASGPA